MNGAPKVWVRAYVSATRQWGGTPLLPGYKPSAISNLQRDSICKNVIIKDLRLNSGK